MRIRFPNVATPIPKVEIARFRFIMDTARPRLILNLTAKLTAALGDKFWWVGSNRFLEITLLDNIHCWSPFFFPLFLFLTSPSLHSLAL
jgi:hypothetical protein